MESNPAIDLRLSHKTNLRLSHKLFRARSEDLGSSSPHDNVVRVRINDQHGNTLWLRLKPVFKSTCVLSTLISCANPLRLGY
jgi:hypothetical protein